MAVGGWAVLVAGAFLWGYVLRSTGRETQDALPPLYATPRLLTWQLLPAAAVAAGAVAALPALARRLAWRPLLLVAWAATVVWAVALAVSDGLSALAHPLTSQNEYLAGLPAVRRDPLAWLRTFTERLPGYPVHTQGHPPLPMLFLWLLDATGLGGATWAAVVLIVAGSSAVAAIAITVRGLAGEAVARRALPFLVLAPFALWIATSMDALFLAVGAWGTALLVVSVRRRSSGLGLLGGVVLGALPYLSYGLLPLFAVPVAALVMARPRRAALVAMGCGLLVVPLACTLAGFWWLDGVAATHRAYLAVGGSSRRPYGYFLFGDLAVLALLVGPAVAHALPALTPALRRAGGLGRGQLVVGVLAGAAVVGMVVLDVSGVTRGEVERIWVPYAAWLVLAAAVHRPPARGWLAVQAATAIAVQGLVLSGW